MESRAGDFKNPIPTVDIIIELDDKGIILIKRKNPPYGWAIPGGFVDYGFILFLLFILQRQTESQRQQMMLLMLVYLKRIIFQSRLYLTIKRY